MTSFKGVINLSSKDITEMQGPTGCLTSNPVQITMLSKSQPFQWALCMPSSTLESSAIARDWQRPFHTDYLPVRRKTSILKQ